MDFLNFLKSKKETALKLSESENLIKEFIDSLTKNPEEKKIQNFTNWIEWILSGGEEPKSYFANIKEIGEQNSGCCRESWREGELCYECRTCGLDPTSAICVKCFLAGNHEGHDYSCVKGGIGMCDCGDDQSWDPAGNCKFHHGTPEHPENFLPEDFRTRLPLVISSVLDYLVFLFSERLSEIQANIDPDLIQQKISEIKIFQKIQFPNISKNSKEIIELLNWFTEFIDLSDGVRRLTGLELAAKKVTSPMISGGNEINALEFLIRLTNIEKDQLNNSLVQLWYNAIRDQPLKKEFFVCFLHFYQEMIFRHCISTEKVEDTSEFSVQLFTKAVFAPIFCEQYNLLEIQLETLLSVLSEALVPFDTETAQKMDPKPLTIDLSHPIILRRSLWKPTSDMKFVLNGIYYSQFMMIKRNSLFKSFLQIISKLQGVNRLQRQYSAHILFEDSTWEKIFFLYFFFNPLFINLIKGFISGENEITPTTKIHQAIKPGKLTTSLKNSIDQVMNIIVDAIILWTNENNQIYQDLQLKKILISNTFDNSSIFSSYKIYNYDISLNPVSVHLPLQRLLAVLTVSAAKQWGLEVADVLGKTSIAFPLNFKKFLLLIEHVVRSLAVSAQIDNGFWNLNGMSIRRSSELQKTSPFYSLFFDCDLLLLQIAVILMDSNLFISSLANTFQINKIWYLNSAEMSTKNSTEPNAKFVCSMGASFLRLIIMILIERAYVGSLSQKQILRREVIHWLCVKPNTHSTFKKLIDPEVFNEQSLEQILHEVALSPKESVIFHLNPKFWSEFEGQFFPHYSPIEIQKAEENYLQSIHMKNKKEGTKLPAISPRPFYKNPHHSFRHLPKILFNHQMHKILFGILFNYTFKSVYSSEEVLNLALICIQLILQIDYLEISNEERERMKIIEQEKHKVRILKENQNHNFDSNENLENMTIELKRKEQELFDLESICLQKHKEYIDEQKDFQISNQNLIQEEREYIRKQIELIEKEKLLISFKILIIYQEKENYKEKEKEWNQKLETLKQKKFKLKQKKHDLIAKEKELDDQEKKNKQNQVEIDQEEVEYLKKEEELELKKEKMEHEKDNFSEILKEEFRFPTSENFLINAKHEIHTQKGDFSFVTLLIELHTQNLNEESAFLIQNILQTLQKKSSEFENIIGEKIPNFVNLNKQKEEEERQRMAKLKREQIMAQFNIKINKFAKEHKEELVKMENVNEKNGSNLDPKLNKDENANQIAIDSSEKKAWTVFDSNFLDLPYGKQTTFLRCVLCKEETEPLESKPLGLIGLTNISNLSQSVQQNYFIHNKKSYQSGLIEDRIHVLSCGHLMHIDCYQAYLSSLIERSLLRKFYEGMGIIDITKAEYLCPLERQLANVVVPIIPDSVLALLILNNGNENENENKIENQNENENENQNQIENQNEIKIENENQIENQNQIQNQNQINDTLNIFEKSSIKLTNLIKKESCEPIICSKKLTDAIDSFIGSISFIRSELNVETNSEKEESFWIISELVSNSLSIFNNSLISQENPSLSPTQHFQLQTFYRISLITGNFTKEGIKVRQNLKNQLWNLISNCTHLESKNLTIENADLTQLFVLFVSLFSENISLQHNVFVLACYAFFYPLLYQSIRSIFVDTSLQKKWSLIENCGFDEKEPVTLRILNESDLIPSIESLCLPFFRKILLYHEHCIDQSSTSSPKEFRSRSFSEICEALGIEISIENFLNSTPKSFIQFVDKCKSLRNNQDTKESSEKLLLAPIHTFSFYPIPTRFNLIWHQYERKVDDQGNPIPENAGLCLITGNIVDLKIKNALTKNTEQDIVRHSRKVGGNGLYLCIKGQLASAILSFIPRAGVILLKSIFKDKWNEEDIGVRRGKDLYLDSDMLKKYEQMFLTGELLQEVLRNPRVSRSFN
ncbi:ubiquitin ligase e3 alpha-related [Anaeramoeba ignava]|uniref:E3 ubiquitin-protein ligase n=1 Tax=Anaeramoeba ignava TaxID=1746090 RepID=A0A9Q0LVU6_ANAIG|nr:ubiquitin ligase e3 alpha-related [Anaeramoeba ignava]